MKIYTACMDQSKRSSVFLLLLSFTLFTSILFLSFRSTGFPKGSDTPAYYLHLKMLQEEGYTYLLKLDRPLTLIFLDILDIFLIPFNLSPPYFLLCTQVILGLVYISSIFFVVSVATRNKWIAGLSSVLAATSANTLRFQPLVSNLLSLSFAMYSLVFFVKYQIKSVRNSLFVVFFLLVLSYFAHPWQAYFTIIILIFSLTINTVIERSEETTKGGFQFLVTMCLFLALFVFVTFFLWKSTFFDLVRRIGRIWNNILSISTTSLFNSARDWMFYETWTLKITGLIGSIFIRKYVEKKNVLTTFYLWFIIPILADALLIFGSESDHFFILTPFAVFSSFLIYDVYCYTRKINLKFKIFARKVTVNKRFIPFLFIGLVLAVNYCEAFSWQYSSMGPFITRQEYEMLLNARKYVETDCVIPVYPVMDKGVWAESILGSLSRRVFVYYGKISNLVKDEKPIHRSQLGFELPGENYTIVLLKGLYPVTLAVKEIFREIDETILYLNVHNNSQYACLANIDNPKIATIGWEADLASEAIRQLGFSCDYLGDGNASLPDVNSLEKYDLLILLNWWIPCPDDVLKLSIINRKKPIIALFTSGYYISSYNVTFFEEAFGAKYVSKFSSHYNKISYFDNGTSLTSHLTVPYTKLLTGASPVMNLTTARGLARMDGSDNLYVLIVNERSLNRNAFFGIDLADMDPNEFRLFKRLILWALGLLP